MSKNKETKRIDMMITVIPLVCISLLTLLFFVFPAESNEVLSGIRFFFGDTLGLYYLVIGLGIFAVSVYMCVSKYGGIVLGEKGSKPEHSFFSWGCMMFTCGLAADILFYSFSEWVMYAAEDHVKEMGDIADYAGVYPLFHWSFIPWSFYLVLAVAFGFMLHVRKRDRKRFSEACRPILGKHTDGLWGRIIDLFAVFALLAGTATTFSVATPLMAEIIKKLFNVSVDGRIVSICIIVITCMIYTYSLLHGIRGINVLAKTCIYMFYGLLLMVLFLGGNAVRILESGFQQTGIMINRFIELSTFADPARTTSFPQNWTIYYWAYWMVWCIAAPFFIGAISKGRTVREVVLGGYVFGTGSTLVSFIILGNYGMSIQFAGGGDFIGAYASDGNLYSIIIDIINTLPVAPVFLVLVLADMMAFYATSFDSIALTASYYSYRSISEEEVPDKRIQLLWCILLILLPVALVFSESSMSNLQTVSIIAAFPVAVIMIMIILSFFKDAGDAGSR